MPVIEINGENIFKIIEETPLLFVDLSSPERPLCKEFKLVIDEASVKYKSIVFGRVNTDVERDIVEGFSLQKTPTLIIFKEGIEVHHIPGAVDAPMLRSLIDSVREIDMDAVRAEIENRRKKFA